MVRRRISGAQKWSASFWADWGERVLAVLLYTTIGFITTLAQTGLSLENLWPAVGTAILLPVLLSALKGLLANVANPESGASVLSPPPGPVLTEEAPNPRGLDH